MASENMSMVPAQSAAHLLFHGDPNNPQSLRFAIGSDPGAPKTRELSGFLDDKLLNSADRDHFLGPQAPGAVAAAEFRRGVYVGEVPERRGEMGTRNWNGNVNVNVNVNGTASTDSEGDEDEEDEEDDEEEDGVEEVDEGDKIPCGHSKDRPSFGKNPKFVVLLALVSCFC